NVVDTYNADTGTWSTLNQALFLPSPSGILIDGQYIFPDQSGVKALSFSPVAQPANPGIADGSGLSGSPTELRWDDCQGAASYDVYLDGVHVGQTVAPQWTLDNPLANGGHTWQIVARAGSPFTAGPVWKFTIGFPSQATGPTP